MADVLQDLQNIPETNLLRSHLMGAFCLSHYHGNVNRGMQIFFEKGIDSEGTEGFIISKGKLLHCAKAPGREPRLIEVKYT